jgi:excinuclease UvrABC ATPase subunit
VPALRGSGSVTDFDLTALYDDSKSLNEGALTIPGYSMDGWYGRIFTGCGFFDPDKAIRSFTKKERHDLLYKEPTKIKVDGINLTYEGLIPRIQKSMLSKDPDAMQPHIRAFVERAVTFTRCPECGGTRLSEAARSSKINGVNIADACAMQITDLAEWVSSLDEPPWRRCCRHWGRPSTRSWRSGWATSASIARRARCRVARRSARR